ncbi:hypothetical protein Sango_0013500 [Sesamum angolense]|uniref:Uncharacterized protein n=1 Tax=Sesamum angolense TaxID=2727404 RepID=A0AAE1XCS5_9LAMI|nr:hypothetical protein Sango_0013500 [Sesamum angolense]
MTSKIRPGEAKAKISVAEKIRASRLDLLQWDWIVFGNIRSRTQNLNQWISKLYQNVLTAENKAEIGMLKNEVEDMASKEETMWKQRAKALWLAEGDRSTSFFHARANERRLWKEI